MFQTIRTAVVTAGLLCAATGAMAVEEVNLYSYRQPFLIKPLLEKFTAESGIKVNVVFAKKGMVEKIKAAGNNNPADAVLTTDVGRLDALAQAGLLEPVRSKVLEANVPAHLRHSDGLWFGLTTRARVALVSKERVVPGELATLADLAKPRFKGRVCTRSGKHVYNVGLIASVIVNDGAEYAEQWLHGVKANLARKPHGNDRAQAKGIYQGACDVAIVNQYYMGLMATNEKKPEQKKWAEAVHVVYFDQDGRGQHVNVSGAAVINTSKRKANAVALLEYLVSESAQSAYAQDNFEYPVRKGVALHPLLSSWGTLKTDTVSLQAVARARTQASKLVDKVGFNAGN